MMTRIFRRAREQKGQVLLIVVLLTTVFMGMVAMAVDVGLFAHERQRLQDTVDAAALAGAQQIPDNLAQAKTDALTYATANDSTMTATVTFRCIVGDRDHNGVPDAGDIGVVCNPGPNGSWTCSAGRCVSLCVPSEGDACNTIVVAGSKNVPFIFARAIHINSADTGDIRAAACKGACGGPPTAPLDVVEIIDRTSSMDATELADAKNAAETVLKAYNPSLQHVALGVLGPSLTSSTCGAPNAGGYGLASSDQLVGSWVPVPFSSDYVTGAATPTLNTNSVIVKSINCLNNSSVGTNLGDPVKAAATYVLASGRPNVKKAIMLFTDGAANAWITPPPVPTPTPTNTGYLNCSANLAVPNPNNGDGNGYQTTPGNACASGGGVAQDSSSGSNTGTSCTGTDKDKHDFYNYGLSVPSGATINGIEVRLDAYIDSAASTTRRLCVQLSWNGGTSWTTAQQIVSNLTTSQATYTLGSAVDTWGRAWSTGDFSNANFRVRVTDVANSTSRTFNLDWVPVRVTYTPAGGGGGGGGAQGPCDYAVQNATAAKAQDIEIFTLGYGLSGEICGSDNAGSPWYNKPVTQVLAAMATNSVDETGCTTSAGVTQENADGDHFYCEIASGGLSAIFQQAAVAAAASPILINLP